jgi:hypothetical protein
MDKVRLQVVFESKKGKYLGTEEYILLDFLKLHGRNSVSLLWKQNHKKLFDFLETSQYECKCDIVFLNEKGDIYHGIATTNNFDLYKAMQKMFKEGMARLNQSYDNKFELNYINTI